MNLYEISATYTEFIHKNMAPVMGANLYWIVASSVEEALSTLKTDRDLWPATHDSDHAVADVKNLGPVHGIARVAV